MPKLQIGLVGSCADLSYAKDLVQLAEDIGVLLAQKEVVLIYGAEKDFESLSTAACRGAKKSGGVTVGITYGRDKKIIEPNTDIIIATGLDRGGGREFPLVLSCDAIIAISGGSGTLTEIAMAYQADIPVVVLHKSGGWSEKLAGTFLDERNRFKIESASSAKEAVAKAIELASQRRAS
jgi:uncharacterized protein (TIGR00725 family)